MSAGNYIILADNRCLIFASASADGGPPAYRDYNAQTPVQLNDLWFDIDAECIRTYQNIGFGPQWSAPGVFDQSYANGVYQFDKTRLNITDKGGFTNDKTLAYPGLIFSYGNNRVPMYSVIANNDELYFTKADGSVVLTLQANGNALFANNVTITGDLFADDISYDEETVNLMKVNTEIQHLGNPTNRIAFDTDKMTLDASGTSILLDDTAMTDKIVITGQTKFVNNIDDVPDIYLQNHVYHSGDTNTRIGFPANDQIGLRTGGSDRILVQDSQTSISNSVLLNATQPRIVANMNGGTWDTRLIMQTSNANQGSKLYILPNGTGTNSGIVFANASDLNGASYNLAEFGQYPTEIRCWSTAASGTPLPFVWRSGGSAAEMMRLVNSSNIGLLGLNEANPECQLHISKAVAGGEGAFIFLDNPSTSTAGSKTGIRFANNAGASFSGYGSYIESVNVNAGNGAEEMTFGTWNGGSRGERMRLDVNGALLVGEANNQYNSKIYTSGGPISTRTSGVDGTYQDAFIAGYTSNYNERNVIKTAVSSSGSQSGFQFMVSNGGGSSATTENFRISNAGCIVNKNLTCGTVSQFDNVSFLNTQVLGGVATKIPGTGAVTQVSFFNDNGRVGYIGTSGTTTTYYTSSDARLKHNIVPSQDSGPIIDNIKVRQFNWNVDESLCRYGFIAQELYPIFPEAVGGSPDGEVAMAVDFSKLVPIMLKEIQQLRVRVNALEAK